MRLFGREIKRETLVELTKYAITGAGTTATNFLTYLLLTRMFGVDWDLANGLSWFAAVLFTFFADKFFVFGTKRENLWQVAKEMLHFLAMRLASGVIEIGGFYIFASHFGYNDILVKAVTGVVVIAINYFISKFVIFAQKQKG